MKPSARSDHIVPLRGMRGMIADKMRRSIQETAQLTHHADCCATALLSKKAALAKSGLDISTQDLILDQVVTTLLRYPYMNGVLKDRQVHLSAPVHLSIAIALPGDLLVAPTLFNYDAMTLDGRVAARRDIVQRARTNKLTVQEMTGGTFTVSNLGLSRVKYFTPILNTPQIAILGIGEMRNVAAPDHAGGIGIFPQIGLSLTFDHQAIDGLPAAAFLSDLCSQIETAS